MKRFFKSTSATRNIALLAVLLGIISAMILTVKFWNREPVFILPELRGEIAERRYGPNNAFPELKKIADQFYKSNLLISSFVVNRQAQPMDPPGRRETTPEEKAAEKAFMICQDAGPATHEVLIHKSDYLLIPPNNIPVFYYSQMDSSIERLGDHLLLNYRKQRFEETVVALMDPIRLFRLTAQEFRYFDLFPNLERKALDNMVELAQNSQDVVELDYLHEALEQLGPPYPEPRKVIENWWRFLDDSLAWPKPDPPLERIYNESLDRRINRRMIQLRLQSRMKKIIREKEKWYALIEQRPEQVYKALDKELDKGRWPYRDHFNDASQIIGFVNTITQSRTDYFATLQAVALLRYRLSEGVYPDDLSALVPAYLPELPQDPFAEAPYCYRKTETGCLLYSRSYNARDDNGTPMHDTAIISLNGEAEPVRK